MLSMVVCSVIAVQPAQAPAEKLPDRVVARLGAEGIRLAWRPADVKFSPDGKQMIVVGRDHEIQIVDTTTWRVEQIDTYAEAVTKFQSGWRSDHSFVLPGGQAVCGYFRLDRPLGPMIVKYPLT